MAEKNMNAKISVEFEETANRQQLSSGDNLPTLFGKIKKFFTDLKSVALSGSYNDLDDKPVVDSELDVNSENLIQNKVVAEAFQDIYAKTVQNLTTLSGVDIKEAVLTLGSGCVFIDNTVTGMPVDGTWWFGEIHRSTEHLKIEVTRLGASIANLQKYYMYYNSVTSIWIGWKNIADGGNADTLDGLHAASFFQEIGAIASGSIKDYALSLVGSGAVFANSAVTDMPFDNSYWFVIINKCNTNHILMEAINIGTNKKYIMTYNAGTTPPKWYEWTLVNPMSETDKTKLDNTNLAYGTCATAAATAAKVVTITGNTNWKLAVGSEIVVKFTNTNTASNCTLNVNNTGAKQIWFNNAVYTGASSTACGYANRYLRFMYDGKYWVWMGWSLDANTWTAASTSANGYVSTGAQTFAGAKTFNGIVKVAGATAAGTSQVRNIAAGTAAATTTNCPNGALYGQYS